MVRVATWTTGASSLSRADSGAELLLDLATRDPWLALPAATDADASREVGESTVAWARHLGLITTEPAAQRLRRAGFERMAARAFGHEQVSPTRVGLLSRWLAWLFYLDDQCDEAPPNARPDRVDDVYGGLLAALQRGQPGLYAGPIETALSELWNVTAADTSAAWRERFIEHFLAQWQGVRAEDENRAAGRIPTLEEYPALRRDSNGTFLLLDLIEPFLEVELLPQLAGTPVWVRLNQVANDVIVWCNDLASLPRELAHDDVHNYVIVAAEALGLDAVAARSWVADRIVDATVDMRTIARSLPGLFARLDLSVAAAAQANDVVEVIRRAPANHLAWLLESHRYQDAEKNTF
ncbi:MAG TPA: terpene synthase family protein [Acidimicrobiales bacterium]